MKRVGSKVGSAKNRECIVEGEDEAPGKPELGQNGSSGGLKEGDGSISKR